MPNRLNVEDHSDEIKDAIRRGIRDAIQDISHRIEELAIRNAPVGDGTGAGNLQRSIYANPVTRTTTGLRSIFGADADYAASQEFGSATKGEPFADRHPMVAPDWPTVPPGKRTWTKYEITPTNADALRFNVHEPNTGGTKTVFAQKVMHPGVEPQPFMRPAIDQVRLRDADDIVNENVQARLTSWIENR
jgi:hypothetical protein